MTYAHAAHRLPMASLETLVGSRAIVVIAPHPDDETLGCGGLLAWAVGCGVSCDVVYLTSGEQSHPGTSCDLSGIRRAEATAAAGELGLMPNQLHFLGLPDAGLPDLIDDARRHAMQRLQELAAQRRPALFLVTADTDTHGDHRAAFALVREAVRDAAGVELMTYPVWSWLLEAAPAPLQGVRVDIGQYRAKKSAALRAYESQRGTRLLDVGGFTLPNELLRHAVTDTEVFLRPSP